MLDWLVKMDFNHHITKPTSFYKPSGGCHFYLSGSKERFTSSELINIFNNKTTKSLYKRWMRALEENAEFTKHILQ